MSTKGQNKGQNIRGVYIAVYSSVDGQTEVTSVSNATTLRHWVYMKNFTPYDAKIDCHGHIDHPTPIVEFVSSAQGDAKDHWTVSHLLRSRQEISFSSVVIQPTTPNTQGRNQESIRTEIYILLEQPKRTGRHTFNIQIQV